MQVAKRAAPLAVELKAMHGPPHGGLAARGGKLARESHVLERSCGAAFRPPESAERLGSVAAAQRGGVSLRGETAAA